MDKLHKNSHNLTSVHYSATFKHLQEIISYFYFVFQKKHKIRQIIMIFFAYTCSNFIIPERKQVFFSFILPCPTACSVLTMTFCLLQKTPAPLLWNRGFTYRYLFIINQILYSSSPYVGKGQFSSSTSISSLSAGSLSSFIVWNT